MASLKVTQKAALMVVLMDSQMEEQRAVLSARHWAYSMA